MTGLQGAIGMFAALRRRAKEGGSYLVRVSLSRNCSWMQDFGLFDAGVVFGAGLPEALLSGPGLAATLRPEFALPLAT
ncbi:MAG TPA: hypothetical protein VKG78_10695 [Opitutaceae bacterium]|nr:hypothetical protein [Opitutaceae bacterium]